MSYRRVRNAEAREQAAETVRGAVPLPTVRDAHATRNPSGRERTAVSLLAARVVMDASARRYRIRLARSDEVARLRQIEDEAGTLFHGLGLIDESLDPSFPLETAAELVGLGQVWVACLENDLPVAMAITSVRDDALYLDEMDVVPGHGRRGLGARLLEHVCAWAHARGHRAVTLSTFRDVPWNGAFYRKHGFRDLLPAEWSPGMRAIRENEARHGLCVEARVFMRRALTQGARSEEVGRQCDITCESRGR